MGLFLRKPHQCSTRTFSLATILKNDQKIKTWNVRALLLPGISESAKTQFSVSMQVLSCWDFWGKLHVHGKSSLEQKEHNELCHILSHFFQVLLQAAIADSWNQQQHTLNPSRAAWKSISTGTERANYRGWDPHGKPAGCFTAAQTIPPNASQLSLRGLLTPQHLTAVHIKSIRTAQET